MRTELFVSRVGDQIWSALRQGGRTVEFRVEACGDPPRLGRIVMARVTRVLPAIQAAFLDVGADRDAFLHVSDLLLPGDPPPVIEEVVDGEPRLARRRVGSPPIQDRLEPGRELLVQISRESRSTKGDRATCFIGIPGRLLVLLPLLPQVGISRRIYDPDERARLARILRGLDDGRSGFVARTAAKGAERGALEAEAERLFASWQSIRQRAETALPPAVVHDEPPLTIRLLRDAPTEGLERVVLDDAAERDRALEFLDRVDSVLSSLIQLHSDERPLFATYGLDDEILQALRPRVWLPSGGYLIIEQTEALVSIDVNTGKSVRGSCQESTSLGTNLEAADEIARQLRLRDLGGIVVIDFVDMESVEHRRQLVDTMTTALRDDPARTKIISLSDIGLMQLTRKRTRSGFHAALTQACPTCSGEGKIVRSEIVAALSKPRG
jgi:ribonuclease G